LIFEIRERTDESLVLPYGFMVSQWHMVLDQFEESLWLNTFSRFGFQTVWTVFTFHQQYAIEAGRLSVNGLDLNVCSWSFYVEDINGLLQF